MLVSWPIPGLCWGCGFSNKALGKHHRALFRPGEAARGRATSGLGEVSVLLQAFPVCRGPDGPYKSLPASQCGARVGRSLGGQEEPVPGSNFIKPRGTWDLTSSQHRHENLGGDLSLSAPQAASFLPQAAGRGPSSQTPGRLEQPTCRWRKHRMPSKHCFFSLSPSRFLPSGGQGRLLLVWTSWAPGPREGSKCDETGTSHPRAPGPSPPHHGTAAPGCLCPGVCFKSRSPRSCPAQTRVGPGNQH